MKLKTKTQRIEYILNLWENSDGLSLKLLMNKIINKTKQEKKLKRKINEFHLALDTMLEEEKGAEVYEALARAFSIQMTKMDSYGILAILEARINAINKDQGEDGDVKDFMKKPGCLDIQVHYFLIYI